MNQNENVQVLINELTNSSLNISFQKGLTESEFRATLSDHINSLILNNFTLLVSILYRLDISEKKLKEILLQQTQANAGNIIADLIVEKQLQKIETRKKYFTKEDINQEDSW